MSTGRWTGRPTKYKFAWKACNKHAARCKTIRKARKRSYKLTASDVGRVIRGQVSAINPAGTTTAMTAASALVR